MPAAKPSPAGSPDYVFRKNRQLSALVEMNREIHSTVRIHRLLQILVEKVVMGLNLERSLIYLLEDDYLRCVAFLDSVKRDKATLIDKTVGFRLEEKAVEVLVAKLGKSIFVHDAEKDIRMSPKLLKVTGIKQYCVVPLIGRDKVLGVFTGDKHYSGKPILQEDLETLELFAGHISLAIENAMLYEEKEQFNKVLEEKVKKRTEALAASNHKLSLKMKEILTLYHVSQLLNKSLEVDDILNQILPMVQQLGYDKCAIHSGLGAQDALISRGLGRTYRDLEGTALPERILSRLGRSADPFLLGNMRDGTEPPAWREVLAKQNLTSCFVIPLQVNQAAWAVILLYSPGRDFSEAEQKTFFCAFARQAGAALERALMFKQVVEQKHDIEVKSAKLQMENIYLKDKMRSDLEDDFVIGNSPGMKQVMDSVYKVAPTDTTVMIHGETGTGKEVVAKAIHSLSRRQQHPLITVNCAAIPESLIESELFGHEKGSFTGAHKKRIGMFELAHTGTIFLDEIGELSAKTQTKILRVLQEQELQPIGSKAAVKVDVRIIAATNKDLKAETDRGNFRPDLYYRLNVFPIRLPPLRERAEDIPELIKVFVNKHGRKNGFRLPLGPRVLTSLYRYQWPGNIRELENIIERLIIICRQREVTVDDLPAELKQSRAARSAVRPLSESLFSFKREMVSAALTQAKGKKSEAARLLGLAPSNLSRLLKSLEMSLG